ncbi:MAG TPA: nucleotide-binding protein [Gemmatimonadaceae bacterium]|nr:nucleotide-binding protein [Gemmatimonadaceae bacterium]
MSPPNRTCFLIAPIGLAGSEVRRRSDLLFEHVIRPATQAAGYELLRADQINVPGPITGQIVRLLLEADLVVADISGLNPNVMYELGIRHAARRPVIQLVTKGESIPFDIANIRTIVFDVTSLDSADAARQTLIQFLSAVDSGAYLGESPVTAALDLALLEKAPAEPTDRGELPVGVVNVLKAIDSRLAALEHRLAQSESSETTEPQFSRRVFIVHGHDGVLKNELARLLEKLDFVPIILHEQPDRGQTIIQKLGREMTDVGFAFVVLTPDDIGAVATEPTALRPRARQNVVFEHGLFAGRFSHSRVCAVRRGDVEIPSDLHGVVYKTVPVGGGISSIAIDVANELKAAGYVVDANRLLSL